MGTTDEGRTNVATQEWSGMVAVGRVARAHGRRGEVIVNLETDFPEQRFRDGGVVYASTGEAVRGALD